MAQTMFKIELQLLFLAHLKLGTQSNLDKQIRMDFLLLLLENECLFNMIRVVSATLK